MEKNKEGAKCIKDFYASLPLKVALDNNLNVTPDENYLLFKEGEIYEVSHEYKTSEEDKNYFRYVASNLKYEVNGKKNVYERFITRKNPEFKERTWNFYEYFELILEDDDLRSMSISKLQRRYDRLYDAYQHEPIFAKAREIIPLLNEVEEVLNEKKDAIRRVEEIVNEEDKDRKSHLN